MQIKLLNFYQIASKIATNIIGAFMALIIYQSTQSFTWAFLYLFLFNIFKLFFQHYINKYCAKYPQLLLILRIFPFLFYSLSIFLLDSEVKILGIFLILIFHGMSDVMGGIPIDYIFSYNTFTKNSTSLGIIRMLETVGTILAILVGGAFLDYLNRWTIILVSCIIYIISALPLLIYYMRNKNTVGFNTEATSNATESLNKKDSRKIQHKMISRQILNNYFTLYILLCFFDFLMTLICLYIFKENASSYSLVAYIQMSYQALYGAGSFLAGELDQRHDLSTITIFGCVVSAVLITLSAFAFHSIVAEVIIYGAVGFFEAFISLFLYSRMMSRCKILGVSNNALYLRKQSTHIAQGIVAIFCAIGPFMFVPAFIFCAISSLTLSVGLPKNEEITRKMLVDYLQENSIN